jgi:flavin reductase (DIM6/NTAB) family NADH-FMN oxidoreductase RutF
MIVSPSDLSQNEIHSILLNSVGPRPIAWVSTISASGQLNLAPFSFFNVVSIEPPLLAFAPSFREPKQKQSDHGGAKDTLRNVRETKEFVVNIVTYGLSEAMNLTSGEYDATVNEFELAKLAPEPSKIVRPPRVGESPVSFECTLHQILDFSAARRCQYRIRRQEVRENQCHNRSPCNNVNVYSHLHCVKSFL